MKVFIDLKVDTDTEAVIKDKLAQIFSYCH